MTDLSIQVCRVIIGCKNKIQLQAAERYMILSGKDFTSLVKAKEEQLEAQSIINERVNKSINDRFNYLVRRGL